jgi:hypothetical protein
MNFVTRGVVVMHGVDFQQAGDGTRQRIRRGHLAPEKEKEDRPGATKRLGHAPGN